jgi:hypothetical protein
MPTSSHCHPLTSSPPGSDIARFILICATTERKPVPRHHHPRTSLLIQSERIALLDQSWLTLTTMGRSDPAGRGLVWQGRSGSHQRLVNPTLVLLSPSRRRYDAGPSWPSVSPVERIEGNQAHPLARVTLSMSGEPGLSHPRRFRLGGARRHSVGCCHQSQASTAMVATLVSAPSVISNMPSFCPVRPT